MSRPSPISSEAPLFVSVPDAARLLGISKTWAYTLVNSGELESRRLGGRVLIPRRVLDDLAAPRAS